MGQSYRDLFIWRESVEIAADVVAMTDTFPRMQRTALIDQMQRAAISVPSNIAEGKGRISPKEFRRFLAMARGSLFELHTQLEIARRINLLNPGSYEHLTTRMRKVGSGINNLMKKLNRSIAQSLNRSQKRHDS